MTENTTAVKYDAQENFNYSFDYSEYAYTGLVGHQKSVFKPALKATLVVLTLVSMIFTIVVMIKRKSNGYRGFRWYSANLMLINFIALIVIVANDHDLAFLIKSAVSHNTYNRLKIYSFDLVELSNIVYVCTTTFLIVEATNRYRQNGGSGFTHRNWFIITALSDLVPFAFVVVQKEFFPYASFKPKPYALYHVLWWSVFGFASFLFITASLCCIKKRKQEEYVEKNGSVTNDVHKFSKEYEHAFVSSQPLVFNHRHLLRLSIFLLATMWIQGPTALNLPADLIPPAQVNPDIAMKIMPKVQPFIKYLLDINFWCTLIMPLVETLACLIFLPSLGDFFCFSESTFHPHTAIPPVF
ncbi:hypothetical protein M3Y97_00353200 [Aphelenchoides bicaudatus]|nr:hypothetical protein M3Y97_00353200 [Aphelenchoides bicaudatus]